VRKSAFATIGVLVLSLICTAQNGKIENLGPLTETSVPDAVRQTLEAKGYRILLDDGMLACELWLRKNVPAQPKKDSQDVIYTQLGESTLIGVLHFPKAGSDFRGQAIPAGFYTLRYALIPNDGNHLGVAPNRDFLLLIPAASDTDPTATFKFQDLVALSRTATGTKHPGPLSLVQPDGAGPGVSKDDQDHWIFSASLKLASGEDLPFSLVVKGVAQQ
jgi:hypothetical protein